MFLRLFRRSFLGLQRARAPAHSSPSTFFCAAPYFLPILTSSSSNRLLSTFPSQCLEQQKHEQHTTPPLQPPPPPNPNTPPSTTSPAPTPNSDHLALLPLLKLQPSHYITIHINAFPFLVTSGDLVTLPFLLKDAQIGDILRLTHASILGSRDYTIKGAPYIDESLFELRATVTEITSEPMRFKEKTKRRQRKVKTVKSKHPYTVLRIGELKIKEPGEVSEGI